MKKFSLDYAKKVEEYILNEIRYCKENNKRELVFSLKNCQLSEEDTRELLVYLCNQLSEEKFGLSFNIDEVYSPITVYL